MPDIRSDLEQGGPSTTFHDMLDEIYRAVPPGHELTIKLYKSRGCPQGSMAVFVDMYELSCCCDPDPVFGVVTSVGISVEKILEWMEAAKEKR